ncbi:MAG: insulinase family protein [Alphaproteobacteria bacterium]|nr:MAG: insulinase family protein [Alphaproteobacteria bacterium]
MTISRILVGSLALSLIAATSFAKPDSKAAAKPEIDVPFEQFSLPNGLRVVVHTDRKAPVIAVNVWYHVGSKDEPAGRSGFAHLFEHLMFNGSENAPGDFFVPFKEVGVTGQNGTTNSDRTNYYEVVPTTAIDMALFMESDRMGHLLGAINQKGLDIQRGVVQNEKRQGQNKPYGQVSEFLDKQVYPVGHPYRHSTIGSMTDLNAASLEDVKNWFRTWYGPNNAVLVLAGDIDVATAKQKVAQYFGDIPASPTMAQPKVDVARMSKDSRSALTDRVPQTSIIRRWNVAEYSQPDLDQLQILSQVLGGSKASRLDKRLLHRDKLVESVSAGVSSAQLGSSFTIQATVKQGVDSKKVEAIIDEELSKLLKEGPSREELEQARTVFTASIVRALESVGAKADGLAECAVFTGNPGCLGDSLRTLNEATPGSVRAAGARWLGKGSHTLVVSPGDRVDLPEDPAMSPAPLALPSVDVKYTTTPGIDRKSGIPKTVSYPELKFPELQRAKLKNGTTVILAERHEVPLVQVSYEFNGGYTSDVGHKLGRSGFAMSMLDEGAGDLDSLAFGNRAESLGASLGAGASLDGSSVALSALKAQLDPSLKLYAQMIRHPRFDQNEMERIRATWIAGIAQEKLQPQAVASRGLPSLLYGKGHPYAIPQSGTGTEQSIGSLTRDDLMAYHKAWIRPEAATLIVVGDTTLNEIVPLLDKHFGDWKGEGPSLERTALPEVSPPAGARVFLVDQPGAVQANIFAAQLVPSVKDPGSIRFDMANAVLGGDFTSRLNMNLREDKHWAYGSNSGASGALGQRQWRASAAVQIDKTAESMQEIRREVSDFASAKVPPTQEELARMQAIQTRSLPGSYQSASAVLGAISGIVRYDRPDDFLFRRKAEVEGMTTQDVQQAARTLDPNTLTWVVVGDLKQIEAPVRALGFGEVVVIDVDGNRVVR